LQYRKIQPLIKSVCQKHGVQYIQQNALIRVWKMVRIAVGAESMKRCDALLPVQDKTIPATSESQDAASFMGG